MRRRVRGFFAGQRLLGCGAAALRCNTVESCFFSKELVPIEVLRD
jgi:hypothetical protein